MELGLITCRKYSGCLIPAWRTYGLGRSWNLSSLLKELFHPLCLIVQHNCCLVNEIILAVCWCWAGYHVNVGWHLCLRKNLASHCLVLLQVHLLLVQCVLGPCKVCRLHIITMSLDWCRPGLIGLTVCDPFNAFHIGFEKPTARYAFPNFRSIYLMITFMSAIGLHPLSFFHLN